MAYTFNAADGSITMPVGDTADIYVNVNYPDMTQDTVIVFGIFDRYAEDVKDIVTKTAEIENGQAHVRLCNQDTRHIAPGKYNWQLRLVSSPAYDENGNVITDACSDNVLSVFQTPPTFRLVKGGAYV